MVLMHLLVALQLKWAEYWRKPVHNRIICYKIITKLQELVRSLM